jgi:hypothetical protein
LPGYLFTRDGVPADAVQPASQVARVSGIARFTFEAADPAMGLATVVIEQEQGDGSWAPLQTSVGSPVSDALPDIVVTYTPDPLSGTDVEPDPVRRHYYHAEWQAVHTWNGLEHLGTLPLGRYRFAVTGSSRDPADDSYPFDQQPFQQHSEPFEVAPAAMDISGGIVGSTLTLNVAYSAALRGYRLLHPNSDPKTATPLVSSGAGLALLAEIDGGSAAPVSLELTDSVDGLESTSLSADVSQLGAVAGQPWRFTVDDGAGNVASVVVEIP